MIGKFRLAKKFATVNTKFIYENIFFDRFNSIFKGYYLIISSEQLAETINRNGRITFTKIPSTECFGSQDITELELCEPEQVTPEHKKMIQILNSSLSTKNYDVVSERN